MLANTRALAIGLITGLLMALFAQQILPNVASASAHESLSKTMASAVKNTLQIAQQALRRGGGYKNVRIAPTVPHPSLPLTARSTIPSPSTPTANKAFSTTSRMADSKSFLTAVKDRRSIYQLNKSSPISDKQIVDIVNTLALHVPSSFNSQSTRLVVLLHKEHDTFWDQVRDVLKPMVPEDQWSRTEGKVAGFKGAYGTVSLFSISNFNGVFQSHVCMCRAFLPYSSTTNTTTTTTTTTISNPH
jgi:hypothetical protein